MIYQHHDAINIMMHELPIHCNAIQQGQVDELEKLLP